jgi:hypothetical protein
VTDSVPAHYARGLLHDDELWCLMLPCEVSGFYVLIKGKSIFFLKQKVVGS